MTNPALDLLTEYNEKVMANLRALGDLNVETANWLINKQVELTNSIVDASLATSKEVTAAKSPSEAAQASSKLVQTLTDSMTGFVKESSDNAVKTREELKAVIDEAVKLNTEYASKAYETGVEVAKKSAKKAA